MELNEIHTDHEQATTSLKVVLLVFAVVLVGALAYLVWAQNTAPDTTDNSGAVVTKKTETTTVKDETADWKSYTNNELGLSFKFPPSWGGASTKRETEEPVNYPIYSISFDKYKDYPVTGYTYITVSAYSDIKQIDSDQSSYSVGYGDPAKKLTDLRSVFTSQNASSVSYPLHLPAINAGVNWFSPPIYVANSDKSFRGLTYYANVSQDSCSSFITNIIVLTDNKNLVLQITNSKPSVKGVELLKSNDSKEACASFKTFVQGLPKGGEGEVIVRDYGSTFTPLLKTIKLL